MDDLRVGMVLKPWRHHVLPAHASVWSELLDDANPIHLDADAVVRLGIGNRPVNQGPANIAYLYNMLAACFPQGRVAALDARMTETIWVGDVVEVTGEITALTEDAAGLVARCALVLRAVPDGATAALATADVRFESPPRPALSEAPRQRRLRAPR